MKNHFPYSRQKIIYENASSWLKLNNLYNHWVSSSNLRSFFSKNACFEGLSLWWISRVTAKDNVIENSWYYNLYDLYYKNKKRPKYNWILFFIKLIKNFIRNLIDLTYYKLIFLIYNKNKKENKFEYKNCFHSYSQSFYKYTSNQRIDKIYGKATFKNSNENFYLITSRKKNLDFLKKKNLFFLLSNNNLTYFEFVKIYISVFFKLITIKNFCEKNNHLFFINKKDCSSVLKPLIYDSFCGYIQNSLIEGISIKNSLKNKKVSNFISYGEFSGGYRSIYYFLKKMKNPIKITAIHHGYANKNLLFYDNKKDEFNLKYDEGKNCSPMPDQYFVQGSQCKEILKNYYPKKIYIIGCLKYDLLKFNSFKKSQKRTKKIKILIAPSIGDEKYILLYLEYLHRNQNILKKSFEFYLSPHPAIKDSTIKLYQNALPKFNFKISRKSTLDLTQNCDLLVCGFSIVAYEAAIIRKPSLRLANIDYPILFHLKDDVKKIYEFEQFIEEINKADYKIANRKKIVNYFFYKLDGNSYKRFWKILS